MSYNIHSCVSIRRRSDPQAIADVIAEFSPDAVALQEVDVHRRRTGSVDQAQQIAARLNMGHRFYPLVLDGDERYGLAILSRYPIETVKFDRLTSAGPAGNLEPRGAMWVKLSTPAGIIHLVNTHLGLTARERTDQISALLGEKWLRNSMQSAPLVLCGDFNAGIRSTVYRRLTSFLSDVQTVVGQVGYPRATFMSMCPVRRIDHIFISRHLSALSVQVPGRFRTRIASDHLPVIADLKLSKRARR